MGVLGLSETLWQFAFVPMDLVGQAALPGLVKETEDRPRLFRELVRICLIAFPFIAICVAGAMPLLLQILTLEDKWYEVPNVLLILVMSVPLRSFQIVANHYTIAEGHARLAFYTAVVYLVAIGILLYPLTEAYGLYGVVGADIIASGLNSVSFAVFMWKGYKNDMKTGMIWSFLALAACAIAVSPLYIYKDWEWRWAIAVPCGLAYLLLLFVMRIAQVSDVHRLIKAVKEKLGR
jgi:O-antigen/teichoic acid export membrane protein